jgi:hypothetical protein
MQRVAIGRALVREPALTLMDEPLSSLDAKLRNDLRLELKRIQQDLGATMLYVTHDQTEALTLATRIGVLDAGHLVQVGRPRDIYENPQTSTVAARSARRASTSCRGARSARCRHPASAATVGVRAERLHLHPVARAETLHGVRARVRRIQILSDQRLVHLASPTPPTSWSASRRRTARSNPAAMSSSSSIDRSGSTRPVAGSPADSRRQPLGQWEPSHATPRADPRRDPDADRSRRRADRTRPGDRRRRPRPQHEARRAGRSKPLARIAGRDLERRSEDRRHDLHARHRRLVGPVFGTLLVTLAKELPPQPAAHDFAAALAAGIAALTGSAKAEIGQKTLLDVLDRSNACSRPATRPRPICEPGCASARSTAPRPRPAMDATRGRASFLGDRALGHVDPGSRSMALIIVAICDSL